MFSKELVRLQNACRYSWQGMKSSWDDAGAFRLEICLTPFIAIAALCMAGDHIEFFMLFASWLLVPLTELVNTAIEAATDLACKEEIHPLAKKAKDCGSAAVAMALMIFALAWLTIFVGCFFSL